LKFFLAKLNKFSPKKKGGLDNGILVTLISPPRVSFYWKKRRKGRPLPKSIDEKKGKQHTLARPKLS